MSGYLIIFNQPHNVSLMEAVKLHFATAELAYEFIERHYSRKSYGFTLVRGEVSSYEEWIPDPDNFDRRYHGCKKLERVNIEPSLESSDDSSESDDSYENSD